MKQISLSLVLLATVFFFGTTANLEAKHHKNFSINFGPMIAVGGSPGYVVQRYQSYPPLPQERTFYDPYGRPYYSERVYAQPYVEEVYVYPRRPARFAGFSFGLNFFR